MNTEPLYEWVFHQKLDGVWECCKREHYTEMWNSGNREHMFSSVDINMLIELIQKTDGNPDKINKLING